MSWRWNVSLRFTVSSRLMWNKEEVVAAARNVRNWTLNPGWTPLSCRAPVSRKCFYTTWYQPPLAAHPSPPSTLKSWPQGNQTPYIPNPGILCPGLFPSCAVNSGCQQAMAADTDGSSGLWWLPYVTSLLWVCAFRMFFFPSLISFSVLLFFDRPEQGGRGERCRGWRGSNAMAINTFQRKERIQSQLEVSSLNDYCWVKDWKVKTDTFYWLKADRR